MLERLKVALAELTDRCYHYVADSNTPPPYITWMEDGGNDLMAGNVHAERCFTGSVHLFTKTEGDPLLERIPAAWRGSERVGISTLYSMRRILA